MEEITIRVTPDGILSLEADGFKGPVCKQVLDEVLNPLDPKHNRINEEKPEFFEEQNGQHIYRM